MKAGVWVKAAKNFTEYSKILHIFKVYFLGFAPLPAFLLIDVKKEKGLLSVNFGKTHVTARQRDSKISTSRQQDIMEGDTEMTLKSIKSKLTLLLSRSK